MIKVSPRIFNGQYDKYKMVTNMMNTGLERCLHFAIVNSEVFLLGTLDDIIVLANLMISDLYDHIDIHDLHD
jgi:hypothetical protein